MVEMFDTSCVSDEVKRRVEGCESPEELLDVIRESGFELTEADIDAVISSGPYAWDGCQVYEPLVSIDERG
jgi:hypothetical protein